MEPLHPPYRLGHINPGLIRGAYPTLRNFRALSRLHLRTVVSLTPEPPTTDLRAFADVAGIRLVHVAVLRTLPVGPALQAALVSALNVCIDAENHPVYIHCLDGRRITSLLVLMLRRLQGWLPLSALGEYWRYQTSSRIQSVNLTEVEKNVREIENFASEISSDVVIPEQLPTWLWGGNRAAVVVKVPGVKMNPGVGVGAGSITATATATTTGTGTGAGVGNSSVVQEQQPRDALGVIEEENININNISSSSSSSASIISNGNNNSSGSIAAPSTAINTSTNDSTNTSTSNHLASASSSISNNATSSSASGVGGGGGVSTAAASGGATATGGDSGASRSLSALDLHGFETNFRKASVSVKGAK